MKNLNFCPKCGWKVEGDPKFCPQCGGSLSNDVQPESLSSKLSGGAMSFLSQAVKKATETTENIKKNIEDKKESTRKIVDVVALKYSDDVQEQNVGCFYAMLGTNKTVLVRVSNKALYIYTNRNQSILNRYFELDENALLERKIDLNEIKQVSRVQSLLTKLSTFDIVTSKGTYSLKMPFHPFAVGENLSKVLTFDSNILNVELQADEEIQSVVSAIVESGAGKNYGTLYMSNKRLVYTRIEGGSVWNNYKADMLTREEGTEVLFSIDIERLKNIISRVNGEYYIKDEYGDFIIKEFDPGVPDEFLALFAKPAKNKPIVKCDSEDVVESETISGENSVTNVDPIGIETETETRTETVAVETGPEVVSDSKAKIKNVVLNLFKVALVFLVLSWLVRACFGSDWVGVYEYPSWRFELRSDGSASVTASDYDYSTTWEDGGDWAVVGAYRGEVFLIAKNGDLFIRGTNGSTTKLFKLKKTK